MIKRSLFEGLPDSLKTNLTPFLDDPAVDLAKFIDNLNCFRDRYHMTSANPRVVREVTAEPNESSGVSSKTITDDWVKEVQQGQEKMIRAVESLAKSVAEGSRRTPSRKWCGYCRVNTHMPRQCPKNPPIGSCFDCLTQGHRKGDSNCPKKQQ